MALKTRYYCTIANQTGFTLVEIMIVCIIVGVLVAMGIPNFIQLQDRAREATVKTQKEEARERRRARKMSGSASGVRSIALA